MATAATGRTLVIVESPAKAKTIAGYLGKDYDVEASVGHIRDLPNPSELPADMKKGPFGKFAVDVDNGFEAYYVVDPDKRKKVAELKRLLKDADQLYLATDEDREGEAIAWHLLEVLKPKVPVKRMVFHEITKEAIQRADQRDPRAGHPRSSTPRRPGASSTGSTATRSRPVLWRKVRQGLSAGRVQSVATRMVVERERRADGVPPRVVLGRRGRLRAAERRRGGAGVHRAAERGRRPRASPPAATSPTTARCARARAWPTSTRRPRPRSPQGVRAADVAVTDVAGEALHPSAVRAVHDLDPAAGGQPQAAPVQQERDARRPAAVRERLHHLHAYRQHDAVRGGADRRPQPGPGPVRRGVRPGLRRAATRRRSRTPRRRTRRSAPPVTGSARRPRSPASCAARSSRSTS